LTEYVPKLNNIIKNFRYKFVNNDLLILALTHSSYNDGFHNDVNNLNNQRLEFLGDAILNFVVAEHLYKLQPNAHEGDLTRIRSYLVKEDTLAGIAKKLLVQNYIILGLGEQKTGGSNKNSILADTLEAIIGAVYLDSDFLTVKNLVLAWYTECEDYQKLTKTSNQDKTEDFISKDPKTILQETLQARGLGLPIYKVIIVTGKPHNQVFQVECLVSGVEQKIYGTGTNRKKAEQDAASKILNLLKDNNCE
jgi:ribonuclease-3